MDAIAHVIRVSLPKYLENLPIPGSSQEFVQLTGADWLSLLPFACAVVILCCCIGQSARSLIFGRSQVCNPMIRKGEPKITDVIVREDLMKEDKVSFCRCWRSKKWPYCDGAHKYHNRATGDNVGALVIRSKDWQPKPKDKHKEKK
ncbi:CDGSH iron-sulfur domain-containing protein 2 homolog [Haliotis cracherodii]|uniref:CDGSH iron-sulfur domain-containing protein 2 homolog n=1 Tax=Haliotis cracherodii TaxID=6455 RepID=UPI0039ED0977